MDHVAIMKKSLKLLPKILSKEKTIESRWYVSRRSPWKRIKEGDRVFFKNAGELITVKADVEKVVEFEITQESQLREIIEKYGGKGKICFSGSNEEVFNWAKEKRYCILIFLKEPVKIEPFEINKEGFGNACAWLTLEDIEKIKHEL